MNIEWNFQTISLICLAGLDLLIFLITLIINCKKGKISIKGTDILEKIPEFIAYAENILGAGNGERKLGLVITLVKDFVVQAGGKLADIDFDKIRSYIESILATPQKKGDNENEEI